MYYLYTDSDNILRIIMLERSLNTPELPWATAATRYPSWTKGEGEMLMHACKAKIHRATVTEADLNYVGSITIDQKLMEAAGIVPFQYLNMTNVSNGFFWRTYAMPGKRDSGVICLNGPPARHFEKGDLIIILAEVLVEPKEMATLDPVIVFVDCNNKITDVKHHSLVYHVE